MRQRITVKKCICHILKILKKKCELTEREISKWFRKRRRNDKVTDIKKLQDARYT